MDITYYGEKILSINPKITKQIKHPILKKYLFLELSNFDKFNSSEFAFSIKKYVNNNMKLKTINIDDKMLDKLFDFVKFLSLDSTILLKFNKNNINLIKDKFYDYVFHEGKLFIEKYPLIKL